MTNTRLIFPSVNRLLSVDRELSHLLGDALGAAAPRPAQRWTPAIDIAERADGYMLAVEIPGVDPSSLDITFDNHRLTIRGAKTASFATTEGENGTASSNGTGAFKAIAVERLSGAFERVLTLPDDVDAERIEAKYDRGILWITVPKAESAKPRKIRIA
jgi:HSP20 family protein